MSTAEIQNIQSRIADRNKEAASIRQDLDRFYKGLEALQEMQRNLRNKTAEFEQSMHLHRKRSAVFDHLASSSRTARKISERLNELYNGQEFVQVKQAIGGAENEVSAEIRKTKQKIEDLEFELRANQAAAASLRNDLASCKTDEQEAAEREAKEAENHDQE